MSFLKYFLICWLGWVAIILSSFGDPVIRITNSEWPPYQAPTAKHFGAASHMVVEIFKESNIGVEFDFIPDNRALKMTKSGKYDATFLWSKSSEREQDFVLSQPLFVVEEVLLHTSAHEFSINGYEDMKPHRLGVTLGYFYGDAFEKAKTEYKFRIQTSSSDAESLERLLTDKVDLIIGVPETMMVLARKYHSDKVDHLRVIPFVVQKADYYVLFSKKSKELNRWVSAFEKGYNKLKQEGRLKKIANAMLEGEYDPPVK